MERSSDSKEARTRHSSRASRGSLGILAPGLFFAVAYIGVFFVLVVMRLDHRFELEWMEGGSLQHLARVAAGLPLYPAPSIEFVPFPYPPLYYYAAALLTPIYGVGFESLRLVSALSAVGSGLLIASIVSAETRRPALGLIAAGIFAASYRASGVYMDVARLDSFYLLLLLAAVALLRWRPDGIGALAGAMAAFAAIATKQTGLVALAPLFGWCALYDWRAHGWAVARWRAFPGFAGVALTLVGCATVLVNRGDDAHFLFYILGAQSGHEIRWDKLLPFFTHDLFAVVPLAFVGPLFVWLYGRRRPGAMRLLFFLAVAVGFGLACVVPRIKVGGALNNLIAMHAVLAIIAGLALGGLLDLAREQPHRRWLPAAISLAVVLQFLCCLYDPRIALPDPEDVRSGERLVARIARVEGEVLIPAQGYLAGMAGKAVFAHQMPVDDLSRSGLTQAEELRRSFGDAIAAQRFALIVDSTSRFLRHYPDDDVLERHYRLLGGAFGGERRLVPRSGWQVSPGEVWVPKTRKVDARAR